jgi:hypothetical protein
MKKLFILIFIFLLTSPLFAQPVVTRNILIREFDNSPSAGVLKLLEVSNGTLVNKGNGVWDLTIGSGTGTGTSDHAALSNLAYALSGHTGFQSTLTNSSGLAGALTDETGSGAVVFANQPTFVTDIWFEGTTPDDNETLIDVIDPTADRTIVLPNASGTFGISATAPATINSLTGDIGVTVLKDLVTTAPITGAADNIFPGADADITLALDFTAAWDFGSATSLEVPNSAAQTPAVAGQIAIDTTDDQIKYYGGALRTIPYTYERCFALETPVVADDNVPIWFPLDAITITSMYCMVQGGTSAEIQVGDGTNVAESIVCDADGQADDGSIANGTFTALERMEFDTIVVTGSVTWVTYCIRYTYDSQ